MAGKTMWTGDMDTILRTEYPKGTVVRTIAAMIGAVSPFKLTRASVVGRAMRLGLSSPNVGTNQNTANKARRKPVVPKPVIPAKTIAKIATEVERTAFDASPALDANGEPFTLENCGNWHCRFISGTVSVASTICGHKRKTNSPYCPDHHLRCFIPPTPYYKKPEPRYR